MFLSYLNPAPSVAADADGAPSSAATQTGMRSSAAAATSSSWPRSVPRSSPFVVAASVACAAAVAACDVVAIPSSSSCPLERAVVGAACPCPSTCCARVLECSGSKRWEECLQLGEQGAAVLDAVPSARASLVRTSCPRREDPGHYSNRKAPIVGRCCKCSRRTLEESAGGGLVSSGNW